MIIDNCLYDKIKILHELNRILWFIKQHAKEDAQKAQDDACILFLNELEKDLAKHITDLKAMVCKD